MKILIIIILCFFVTGCKKDLMQDIYDNISEIRNILYEGEDEEYSVYASLMCGMREENYILNGIATNLIPFGIITFKGNSDITAVEYILKVNGYQYMGELQKNPYEDNFMVDIGQIIESDYILIKFIWGNNVCQIKLGRQDNLFTFNSDDVVENVLKNYKKEISLFKDGNRFNAEVYVKIISEGYNMRADKLWYINIISPDGRSFALIISPKDLQVLTVQKKLDNT